MRTKRSLMLTAGAAAAAVSFFAWAKTAAALPPRPEQRSGARAELRADLQTLFHLRNDADFDRTPPLYDDNGQTVGAFATMLTPALTLHILEELRIYYEVELGLNFWSKNNADQQDPRAPDVFVLKHREIFGEGTLAGGRMGFKVGYARFAEPSGLFLDHWIGVAQTWLSWASGSRLGLFVGQVPDQVYEGILLLENNFTRDIWVFGGRVDLELLRSASFAGALTALHDTHLVGQSRWLLCPSLRISGSRGRLGGQIAAALQAGRKPGEMVDGGAETLLAWAAQAQARLQLPHLELRLTALVLSPDDAYDGNGTDHAFLYSGKSASSTLMITEDELRDWYDNLDERAARFRGGFLRNRAGLFVGDLQLSWRVHERIRPSLILGASTVLKPENALDGVLVGFEGDLLFEFTFTDYLVAHAVVGALVPGRAGAALINEIEREPTDPIVMGEASLLLRY